jgi:hypothetical protein
LKTLVVLMVIGFALAAAAQKQSLQTWNATEGTFAWDEQVKRGGKASIRLHNATADLRSGVMHVIELNQSKPVSPADLGVEQSAGCLRQRGRGLLAVHRPAIHRRHSPVGLDCAVQHRHA